HKGDAPMNKLFDELQRAPKQMGLLMAYIELSVKYGAVTQAALTEHAQATGSQVKSLADKGIFIVEEVAVDRVGRTGSDKIQELELPQAQHKAYDELVRALLCKNVVLLEGVTGSGKTM